VVAQPQVKNCCKVNLSKNLGEGGGLFQGLAIILAVSQQKRKEEENKKPILTKKRFDALLLLSTLRHMHKSEINS
jgi:hypothetical protein